MRRSATGDGTYWLHDNDSEARAHGRGVLVPATAFQQLACASGGADDDVFAVVRGGGGLHQLLREREEARRERQRQQADERAHQRRRRAARLGSLVGIARGDHG